MASKLTYGPPPPAAAEVVVDQLGKARLKRPESLHLVAVPRLTPGHWWRHMQRGTDFHFQLDSGLWDLKSKFEPLVLIFVCLPYRASDPALQERKELLEAYGGKLRQSHLWEISKSDGRDLLCEFLLKARAIRPL
jgi:hypothetical protein